PGFLVVRNSNEVSMEKLPFFIHENLDHRSGGEGQCGDRTPVTLIAMTGWFRHRLVELSGRRCHVVGGRLD
ncbi:hypothetical protein, partial [Rhizobium leguminosarum]|uniref:hypothetical protein n=1 Tax=Rhizobium leguminosarum TaxID=384 RepID=UPI001C96D958